MTLSTLPELQAQYRALSARIAALDRDIALETNGERRIVAQEKRDDLAREREQIAADIMLHGGTPTDTRIEERVGALENDVHRLWGFIKPGPRQAVAKVVFFGLLISGWSIWMIKEVRDWMLTHPAQAIAITLALLVAALIIRWLPEDDHHV